MRGSVFCRCYFWSESRFSGITRVVGFPALWARFTYVLLITWIDSKLAAETKKKTSRICVCAVTQTVVNKPCVCTRYGLRLLRMFTPPARNSIRPWCIISAHSTPCSTRRKWLCWSPCWDTCRPRCAHTHTHTHWLTHTRFHLPRNGR